MNVLQQLFGASGHRGVAAVTHVEVMLSEGGQEFVMLNITSLEDVKKA